MPALPSDLRNKLERVIIDARDFAEDGAQAALEAMAVHHYDPYPHQTPEQRKLRNHLRAHARQLGDRQDSGGRLNIGHLVHECAYEHWHRMLFARFLAENDLLIEPSSGVPISLQECEELAKEAKTDLWTFASRCAQQMLPQIFRPDDPLLHVTLAREHRGKLEALLTTLPQAVFKADDALGWVYQFWQSTEKDKVNKSGEKITGDTLPAVTQLFTEHYMVLFLLHNTIGAWHAGKVLAANPKLAETAASEDELRRAVALKAAGGYSFDYLRFVRGPDGKGGPWRPAAGTFDGWPKRAAELKVLDPCCGSGHFLVAVFALFLRLRMEEEKLSLTEAVDAALRDNIYGLELDARCTQIAAFNLALTAWRRAGHRLLPPIHLACSGIAPNATEEEWIGLAGNDTRLRAGAEQLYQLFKKAPVLGSLINPRVLKGDMVTAAFHDLQPLLAKVLDQSTNEASERELAIAAQGIAKAAEILAGEFTLVATNVPYLGRGKQDKILQDFCESAHPAAKADLATCFIERCLTFCAMGGSTALVVPQGWLFLNAYRKLRKSLLEDRSWRLISRLGARAFETISGEVVNVSLLGISVGPPADNNKILGLDVAQLAGPKQKEEQLREQPAQMLNQGAQSSNPDSRFSFEESNATSYLSKHAATGTGMQTFDLPRFVVKFWEVPVHDGIWLPSQSTVDATLHFGGLSDAVRWEDGHGALFQYMEDLAKAGYRSGIWRAGSQFWGRRGVLVSLMGDLPCTVYLGTPFNQNTGVLIPKNDEDFLPIWCFCESGDMARLVRAVDQSLKVTNGTVAKIPFDLAHWKKVAADRYPNGLPDPKSDDPTQWLFAGAPQPSHQHLQVAVARLLGYNWPRQTGSSISGCPPVIPDGLETFISTNGIVCIPSVRGEATAADRLGILLESRGMKPDQNLDDWLRNDFFEEHCRTFHQRPFIWHIWDGRKRDGFHALVNYHKLAEGNGKGRKLLESLTYSYLGEWISRQQDGVKRGEDGADDRLAAALELQKRLEAILKGEPPFDIFVRWKPLGQQPIGWEPDINDGVRLNIRPFLADDLPNGRTGAGVLRWKPNIKWDKDRGKEPHRPKAEFPWFWGWDEETEDFSGGKSFTGERFNACHYSTAARSKARNAADKVGSAR